MTAGTGSRFPKFVIFSKWVNLYFNCTATEGWPPGWKDEIAGQWNGRVIECEAGLYKLNAVDSELESAWFQPLNL
jgi:hypothetical protein